MADAAPEQLTNLAPLGPEENPCLEDDAEMKFSLHPDDPANFLKLSGALRLLVQNSITNQDIDRADLLIREYCTELITVRQRIFYLPTLVSITHIIQRLMYSCTVRAA